MRKVIDILRLKHEAKLSHEQIARAVGLSKGAVGKYVNLAKALRLILFCRFILENSSNLKTAAPYL